MSDVPTLQAWLLERVIVWNRQDEANLAEVVCLIESQAAQIAALTAERDALRAALQPFASADLTNPLVRDSFGFDVLRARASLNPTTIRSEP